MNLFIDGLDSSLPTWQKNFDLSGKTRDCGDNEISYY